MTGGYIIIDLGGIDLSESDTQTVSGLTDRLNAAAATGKPVLFVNAFNDDESVLPFFGKVTEDGDGHVIDTDVIIMTVSDDDVAVTSALDDVATQSDIADMATQSDIANMATQSDIADMATQTWVNTQILAANTYSTDERQAGVWIDGKPLYQKTIQTTVPTTATDGTVVRSNIDVSALDIGTFVKADGLLYDSTNWISFSGMYMTDSMNSFVKTIYNNADKNLVVANSVVGWSGKDFYVTIQYTKADND